MKNIYLTSAIKEMPRLLSLMDRCKYSPTYGCFDRQYWKYKTRDYNNSRMQEAALTLALLHEYKSPKNKFYKNEKILNYIIAACTYWASRQHRDGSFDEYLYNEKSHVATSFSALAIAHTYYILQLTDRTILRSLKKAAEWLNAHDDLAVINHDAGCIPFFYLLYKITKDNKYHSYLQTKLKKVLMHQNEEGWFEEYGGADIGYQSYTIYYLAKYYKLSKNPAIIKPLTMAIAFFSYFSHPDGSFGGNYGSRNTNFIIPAGFELMKEKKLPYASEISSQIRKAIQNNQTITPNAFDDRFIAEELYTYLDFNLKTSGHAPALLPKDKKPFRKVFTNCGLMVAKTKQEYIILNLRKGGAGKRYKKNRLVRDLGFKIFKKNGMTYSTYGPSTIKIAEDKIIISSRFYARPLKLAKTLPLLCLKLITLVGMGELCKKLVRKILVINFKPSKYSFARIIDFSDNQIKITDRVDERIINLIEETSDFLPVYSTSTEFYDYLTE
jgi:hypothetical protein